jgi:DNA polymerase III alpha subunit
MAAITAAMVKELREMTGAGMSDCKKALTNTDGDMDKAVDWLKENGLAKAEKKAGRIAAEGIVCVDVSDDAKTASIVEVNSETDFVAKNEKFQNYVATVAKQARDTSAADITAFMAEPWIEDSSVTVEENLKSMIATIGCEDLTGRFEVMLYGKSFDTFNRIVEKNKPYIFIGRRQMREESGLTMFADACYLLSRDNDVISAVKSDRAYIAALRESGSSGMTSTSKMTEPVNQSAVVSPAPASKPDTDGRPPQLLRINYAGSPGSEGFNRLLNFLAYFHGNLPVEVRFISDGSIARLDPVCDIMFDDDVIALLEGLVGSGNTEIIRED